MRVLIIEDEEKTGAALAQGLREAGYDAEVARRGDEGLLLARAREFDLILLDIMLPRRDGWEVLSELRRSGRRTPVICLTARDSIEDRVRGLELGANDYVVKPFAFAEVLARIRTVLRRGDTSDAGHVRVGDLELDLPRQRAARAGDPLELTPREFSLLWLLARRHGEVLARREIASEIWGMPVEPGSNAVDVSIRRLRAKVDEPFGERLIHTVRGVGYVLEQRR